MHATCIFVYVYMHIGKKFAEKMSSSQVCLYAGVGCNYANGEGYRKPNKNPWVFLLVVIGWFGF